MGIALRRGVSRIHNGLSSLEKDFSHRLSEGSDELGEISRSINRMASVRGKLEAQGNKSKAAELLGVHRRLLYEKIREYGIE